ncbi:MAG: dihydropteroate synthase [Myxococcota bacterium]
MMGVVNVTPDSFSDGGRFDTVEQAATHALALEAAGAKVLDVGGESTRPGSAPVSTSEQIRRVCPVIQRIRAQSQTAISIDTTDAAVAAAALDAGADLVNDISAFRFDDAMLPLLVQRGCPAIAMHTLAAPAIMQDAPSYEDVVLEVRAHLTERVSAAVEAGVTRSQLLVDPGIGFGKLLRHNLALLRDLQSLRVLGLGIVVGTSRKRFLGEVTGRPVAERDRASAAAAALSIAYGADWVRVHDVTGSLDAVAVAAAIDGAG